MFAKRNYCLLFLMLSSFALVSCTTQSIIKKEKNRRSAKNLLANKLKNNNHFQKVSALNPRYVQLTGLKLNESGSEIFIKPESSIQASVNYKLHCPECSAGNIQIITGLAKRSAQDCIDIYQTGMQMNGKAKFILKAPAKPGKYDIRFRILQLANCNEALQEGWHADNSPTKDSTIGVLHVSRKIPEKISLSSAETAGTGVGKVNAE